MDGELPRNEKEAPKALVLRYIIRTRCYRWVHLICGGTIIYMSPFIPPLHNRRCIFYAIMFQTCVPFQGTAKKHPQRTGHMLRRTLCVPLRCIVTLQHPVFRNSGIPPCISGSGSGGFLRRPPYGNDRGNRRWCNNWPMPLWVFSSACSSTVPGSHRGGLFWAALRNLLFPVPCQPFGFIWCTGWSGSIFWRYVWWRIPLLWEFIRFCFMYFWMRFPGFWALPGLLRSRCVLRFFVNSILREISVLFFEL